MLVSIKVFPHSPKEVIEVEGKRLRVFVREPAQDNRANGAVIKAVAKHFGVTEKEVKIVRGHRAMNKTIDMNKADTL